MNILTKAMNILLAASCLAGCSSNQTIHIQVNNPIDVDRNNEFIEVPMQSLQALELKTNEQLIVLDVENRQVPYQVTHDSLLIFPVSVAGKGSTEYTVTKGIPDSITTISCGRYYSERLDDIAWENDKAAYRAYGPALQASGERAFGYDVFTKSVSEPVVEYRYKMDIDTIMRKRIQQLKEEGKIQEADSIANAISYHIDHGNGMDCYSVGATLGGGTAALMVDSCIIYPYCYKDYDILDNGPLRFTVKLTYPPLVVKNDSNVIETRIITLDKGSHLNHTEITYHNLSQDVPVVSGIVIHPENPDGYECRTEEQYIAYADSTNNTSQNNGVMYLGAVFTKSLRNTFVQWFQDTEKSLHPGALGHVLGISTYTPETTYTYYWGSGWSKGGIAGMDAWKEYLKEYARKVNHPLQVTIK